MGVREAKARLGELVTEVERGGEVLITRRGKLVGRLIPIEPRTADSLSASPTDTRFPQG